MLRKVFGSSVFGIEATTITVEVNIGQGIGYHLVGLPDNAIKEIGLHDITINLSGDVSFEVTLEIVPET